MSNTLRFSLPGFALKETLFCGQSFSWQEVPHPFAPGGVVYRGVAGNRGVTAYMDKDILTLKNLLPGTFTKEDEAFWGHYFAVDVPYHQIVPLFKQFPPLAQCVALCPGLRVLRQPFFDTVLSFIISQNNHIPRITAIVQRLCESFGSLLADDFYTFPTAEKLAKETVESLAPLRAGFRGKYLMDAAHKIAQGQVKEETLKSLDDAAAAKHLKQIYGVGDKVADCILLFSQGRFHISPMDVWMKRAMALLFPNGYPKEISGYQGIAQQFIFLWARSNL